MTLLTAWVYPLSVSEDTTKDISSKYDTAPTIETVLESIQKLSDELRAEMRNSLTSLQGQLDERGNETRDGFTNLQQQIDGLKLEMRDGFKNIQRQLGGFELRFDKLDDKIDVLNGDVLSLRADARRDRRRPGGAATKQDEGTPANDTP